MIKLLNFLSGYVCPVALVAGLTAGCAALDGGNGRERARVVAEAAGFSPLRLECGDFVLRAWLRRGHAGEGVLQVYMEGDGFAWRTRAEPSADPTPRWPRGLMLAAADPAPGPVLYLARPCQYVEGGDRRWCEAALWTSERYGERVVRALNEAVDQVLDLTGASGLNLFGYSGGGTLAALLAERRRDVGFWGTIAGNLDVEGWAEHHRVTPLTASLNPAVRRRDAADIPQVHVVGAADAVVPPCFARAWCADQDAAPCHVVEVPGMTHGGPWEAVWPGVLERFRPIRATASAVKLEARTIGSRMADQAAVP